MAGPQKQLCFPDTGRWAADGPTVQTSGSQDTTCNGLSSSSGPALSSSSPVNSPSVSPAAHSGIPRKTIAIISGSVGGAVLLLALAAIFLCARRRSGSDRKLEWSGSEAAPARPVSHSILGAQMSPLNSSFSAIMMKRDSSMSGPAPEMSSSEMCYAVASPGWDGRYSHMPVVTDAPSMHMTRDSGSHITMTATAGPSTSAPPTNVAPSSSVQELPPPYIHADSGKPRPTDGKRNLQVVGPESDSES
ncbi:hypothetical protein GGX14DRAFT_564365 [Mycena pura]|uniref:Uncharacterized protein n=1 Tax=Mycena pura TaxID=153505 RepID=A0AAD6YBY5_9AGAR|nr:hypothetical protein GGX14DRAFT_564365 [Mycena pura]